MPANVEKMFCTRVAPWHGLGVRIESAVCSEEAFEVLQGEKFMTNIGVKHTSVLTTL